MDDGVSKRAVSLPVQSKFCQHLWVHDQFDNGSSHCNDADNVLHGGGIISTWDYHHTQWSVPLCGEYHDEYRCRVLDRGWRRSDSDHTGDIGDGRDLSERNRRVS